MSIQTKNIFIAEKLKLLSNLMLLDDEPNAVWKIKTLTKATDLLLTLDVPAENINDFSIYNGIGKSTSDLIIQLIKSGTCNKLELLRQKYPNVENALNLMVVPGVGIKTAFSLYNRGITTLKELEAACNDNIITNKQIAKGIKIALKSNGRLPLNDVYEKIYLVLDSIRNSSEVLRAEFAGSIRRVSETIKDVDIIVLSKDRNKTTDLFLQFGEELIRGDEKVRIMFPLSNNLHVQYDLLYANEDNFGSALAYFSGSKEHNISIRRRANMYGYTYNEHGLYKLSGERIGGSNEKDVYSLINLPYCPPELREEALLEKLPLLFDKSKINGDYHTHTTYSSDAIDTIEDMVKTAAKNGLKYIGFTDHTEKQYGFNPEDILKRKKECDLAAEKYNISVYASCETGVNKDGTLDWPDEYLQQMDYVIASIHRGHYDDPVKRLIEATKHNKVKIIGHPTGRMLGRREIPDEQWRELFKICADKNILLEINGARMDLNTSLIKEAKSYGCKFVLNSDAHSVNQFCWQELAIGLAYKAELNDNDLGIPTGQLT